MAIYFERALLMWYNYISGMIGMNDDLNKIKTFKDLKNIFVNLFPIFFRRKNKIGLISLCCYRYEKIYQKEKFDRYL